MKPRKAAVHKSSTGRSKSDDGTTAAKATSISGRTRQQQVQLRETRVRGAAGRPGRPVGVGNKLVIKHDPATSCSAVDGADAAGASSSDDNDESDESAKAGGAAALSDDDDSSLEFDGSSDDDEDSEDEDDAHSEDEDNACFAEDGADAVGDPKHATLKQLAQNWTNGAMADSSKGEYGRANRGMIKWYVLLLFYCFVLQACRYKDQDSAFQTKCGPMKKPYTRFLCLKWMDYQSRRTINWKGATTTRKRIVAGNLFK